jgi:hypothetical protein
MPGRVRNGPHASIEAAASDDRPDETPKLLL